MQQQSLTSQSLLFTAPALYRFLWRAVPQYAGRDGRPLDEEEEIRPHGSQLSPVRAQSARGGLDARLARISTPCLRLSPGGRTSLGALDIAPE